MFRIKIVLGVTALFFLALILFGCSSSSDDDDENITSDETLYEFRIGDMSIDPDTVQIIPYAEENKVYFQFLKFFDPIELPHSMAANIRIENKTKNITDQVSTLDIINGGSLRVDDNEYGSVVTYASQSPFGTEMYFDPEDGSAYLIPGFAIYPGDKIEIKIDFLSAEFDDDSTFFLSGEKFVTYCSREYFTLSPGNLDTGGLLEGIYLGSNKMSDEEINIVALGDVFDITLDFGFQLNPITFLDNLNFRIVVNNITKDTSFVLNRNVIAENGRLFMKDSVKGKVSFLLNHPANYFILDGHLYSLLYDPLAQPGDVLNIEVDFIEGMDILDNNFMIQNKRFQVFYAGSSNDYQIKGYL